MSSTALHVIIVWFPEPTVVYSGRARHSDAAAADERSPARHWPSCQVYRSWGCYSWCRRIRFLSSFVIYIVLSRTFRRWHFIYVVWTRQRAAQIAWYVTETVLFMYIQAPAEVYLFPHWGCQVPEQPSGDCTANLAPYINRQTFLPTYYSSCLKLCLHSPTFTYDSAHWSCYLVNDPVFRISYDKYNGRLKKDQI